MLGGAVTLAEIKNVDGYFGCGVCKEQFSVLTVIPNSQKNNINICAI